MSKEYSSLVQCAAADINGYLEDAKHNNKRLAKFLNSQDLARVFVGS